ncbi:MAG: hypothetical protein ACRENJ_10460 [Candidatus Eiseniibacteriota bacterium]
MLVLLALAPPACAGNGAFAGVQGFTLSAAAVTPATARDSTDVTSERATDADTSSLGSVAGPAERESVSVAPPLRPRRTLPQPGRFDQPRWVMMRSLLVPGWGQAHNGSWIKAVLLAVGDGALRVRFVRDERQLRNIGRQADRRQGDLVAAIGDTVTAWAELQAARDSMDADRIAAAEADRLAKLMLFQQASISYNDIVPLYNVLLDRTINRRWLLGGVVLYALIDAYVDAHFKNFDVNLDFDPALPGGTGFPGGRLQIRWAF